MYGTLLARTAHACMLFSLINPYIVGLVSLQVCYYGQHYHCFAYNQELKKWVLFDDSTVKVLEPPLFSEFLVKCLFYLI